MSTSISLHMLMSVFCTLILGFCLHLLLSCLRRPKGLWLLLVLALLGWLLRGLFGYKVVVLEGRYHPDREVYIEKIGNEGKFAVADLGGRVITGIHANL
jgi:hypothetical protein